MRGLVGERVGNGEETGVGVQASGDRRGDRCSGDGIALEGGTKSGLIDEERRNTFVDRLNFTLHWILKLTLDGSWINMNAVAGEKGGRGKRIFCGASVELNLLHDMAIKIIKVDDITERLFKARLAEDLSLIITACR